MTDVEIAPAVADDAGEILTLQRAAFLRDAQLYGDPFLPSLVQTAAEIRDEITDPDVIVLKATRHHRIVGSVRGRIDGATCTIGRLMTAPDLEGSGIGGRLLAAIEVVAASRVARFELHTGTKSEANIAMYERRGYREYHRHDESPALSVVSMEKLVAPRSGDDDA